MNNGCYSSRMNLTKIMLIFKKLDRKEFVLYDFIELIFKKKKAAAAACL